MGTSAEKHARQKERRDRLNEARQEVESAARRRRIITFTAAVLVIGVGIAVVVALTGGSDEDEVADAPTTSVDVPSTTVADGVGELPAPPPGLTLTDATVCPPTAGDVERVQVFAGPPPDCLTPGASYSATFSTTLGEFSAELDAEAAPATVNNFVVLSRYGYYDGVPFHRVVPGFVIQGGDGDGEPWGNNDLGYTIADELPDSSEAYVDYALAMANSGPDTNGSQFFVVLPGGGAQLQPLYSHFGEVTQGQEIVDAIGALGGGPEDRPLETVLIDSVTITETPAG